MPALTIGIIHQGSRKQLAAALQDLRRNHDLQQVELLVIDTASSKKTRRWVKKRQGIRYAASAVGQTPGALDAVFAKARGNVVLCLEGPVRLRPGALEAVRSYFAAHPDSPNLLHGPLMDGSRVVATHSNPAWRRTVWGRRACDPRGANPGNAAFEILQQEPGVFSCRRVAWPGMPFGWQGHGSEAGYLQERFRRGRARVLCLPGLRWELLTQPEPPPPHSPEAYQALRNHLAGALDVGLDTRYVTLRYRDRLAAGRAEEMRVAAIKAREKSHLPPQPLVSCLLHAGRVTSTWQLVLEEAIESFQRQEYPNKELVLLNDTPELTLTCQSPGVRVVNTSARCPSLGDAYNVAAVFARGDLLAPWNASSVNLPWRLSLSVAELGQDHVYRPGECWYMLDGVLDERPARPDGGSVGLFSREALRAVGGYPSRTLGLHREMDAALDAWHDREVRQRQARLLPQAEWFTMLRRSQDDVQYEGDPFLDPWHAQAQLRAPKGEIVLRPFWREDYVALSLRHPVIEDLDAPGAERGPTVYTLGTGARGDTRAFPHIEPAAGESAEQHLERVAAYLAACISAGATHLVVPRGEASWLSRHPHVAEHMASEHWLVEASEAQGFIFALNRDALPARAPALEAARG